jgi:hypothetical protein
VQEVLDWVSAHAVELVDSREAVGILMLRDGRVLTRAATDNALRTARAHLSRDW